MKPKLSKKSASDYQSSLSSQQSLMDSIITEYQNSSAIISSYSKQVWHIGWGGHGPDVRTPQKGEAYGERSYSEKRAPGGKCLRWGNQQPGRVSGRGIGESEDSKMRNMHRANNYSQCQNQKYEFEDQNQCYKFQQVRKTLQFDEDTQQNTEKENESLVINVQSVRTMDYDETTQKKVRKFGNLLYEEPEKINNKHLSEQLSLIPEQQSRASITTLL